MEKLKNTNDHSCTGHTGAYTKAFTHNSGVTAWLLHLSGLSSGKQLMAVAHLLFVSQVVGGSRDSPLWDGGRGNMGKLGEICQLLVDLSSATTQLKCKTVVISSPGVRRKGFTPTTYPILTRQYISIRQDWKV